MKYLYTLLLMAFTFPALTQTLIVGKVLDNNQHPLPGITVVQGKYIESTSTDKNGYFHILMNDTKEKSLSFISPLFQSKTIHAIDSTSSPLTVMLRPKDETEMSATYYNRRKKRSGQAAFQVDITYLNFDQFANLIGDYNTEVLNGFLGVFNFDFSTTYKRRSLGFSYGLLFSDFPNDSLDIEIIKSQWALHFAYQLVNSKRLVIKPQIAAKWYRYRLLNNHDDEISLNNYLNERDLDLRFNQATGFVGTNIAYKIHPKDTDRYQSNVYWTIGVYGGYLFKLHKEPYIYSTRSRLRTDLEIDLNHINWGIFFTWNID